MGLGFFYICSVLLDQRTSVITVKCFHKFALPLRNSWSYTSECVRVINSSSPWDVSLLSIGYSEKMNLY